MIQLAIETSSRIGSIALVDGEHTLAQRSSTPERGHGRFILREVNEVLQQADIQLADVDVFVANIGPGSFTGVRVGLACARALSWSLSRPVAGADGMDSLAHCVSIANSAYVSPVLDARKGEVYGALYERTASGLQCVLEPRAMPPSQWESLVRSYASDAAVQYVGDGVPLLSSDSVGLDLAISAAALAASARRYFALHGRWCEAIPRYVRAAEAEVKFGAAPEHAPLKSLVRADSYRRDTSE
ncbi:MAG: tRNA (adenosine(37)-N6)-threonylcarbamoyltransferase complex dimerization subunit type 1 TsaB [Myxococcota bacterium]|nr:tRNA (adenosine(37)-N6)-threonylcarbamoyltransferase complex dimerization subunit type 1 TsaB [Myxococcota bacterium]